MDVCALAPKWVLIMVLYLCGTADFPSLILGWWIRTSGREAVTMEINGNEIIIIIIIPNSKNNESHQAELRISLPLTRQNKLASALRSVGSVPGWFLFAPANFTWKHHSAFLSLPCLINTLYSSWWVLSPVCVLLCFIKLLNVSAWETVICHSTEQSVGEETQPTPQKRHWLTSSAFTQLTASTYYSFIMQLFFYFFFSPHTQPGRVLAEHAGFFFFPINLFPRILIFTCFLFFDVGYWPGKFEIKTRQPCGFLRVVVAWIRVANDSTSMMCLNVRSKHSTACLVSHRVPRLGECMVVSVSMFVVPVFPKKKRKKSMIYASDGDDEDKSSSCPCFKTSSL